EANCNGSAGMAKFLYPIFGWVGILLLPIRPTAADEIQFNRDIRPILSANCFACHGFDAKTREADLRLDVSEGAYASRGERPAIVPGKPAESEVWRRIASTDPDVMMPPPSSHKKL